MTNKYTGDCIVCNGTGRLLYPPKPHPLAGTFECLHCEGMGRIVEE